MKKRYNPYSFSRLATFIQCPFKFQSQYINKLRGRQIVNEAFPFGSAVHNHIEKQIYGHDKLEEICIKHSKFQPKTPEFEDFCTKVDKTSSIALKWLNSPFFSTGSFKTEFRFAFSRNGDLLPYDDSNALIRGAIDFVHIAGDCVHIVDWKTGKHEGNPLQLEFYAWALSHIFPDKKIIGEFFYLYEGGEREYKTYKDIQGYKKKFLDIINEIESCTEWPRKKNNFCFFCPYSNLCSSEEKKEEVNNFTPFNHSILR